MNISEKKMACQQPKTRFTRIGNNLKKSIHKSVTLKTVESRNKEFKDALKKAHRKHEYCMEVVTEQRDDEEEWINSLNDAFCEIAEKADAYIEKKIKKSESEILFEGERKYTEELKIHKEEERANVDAAYWWD